MPCWGASRSRPASSRRIGRWLTRAHAAVPAPAAVASAAPSSATTSPISCPATPRRKRETGQQATRQNKRGGTRLPTLVGPSRAGRPHLELELRPLLCARHARDAGVEGRDRLAEGIAGNVVARLVVDDVRRAYHLVLPDHRLLSAPTVRRPAQVGDQRRSGCGWDGPRLRASGSRTSLLQQIAWGANERTNSGLVANMTSTSTSSDTGAASHGRGDGGAWEGCACVCLGGLW